MVRDSQKGFLGGLNTTADLSQLAPNEVRRADNARLTEFGGITKCGGSQRLHATALSDSGAIRGGFSWDNAGSIQQIALRGSTLYTGAYSVGMSWTNRGGTFSSSAQKSLVPFRNASGNIVYVADGGLLNSWNGTALSSDIASTPSVSRLAVYNQRLFGVSGTDETLYWSDLNDGDTLGIAASGGGSAIIRTFGKQTLVGLVPLGASLMMIHKQGISRFTGWTQDDISISTGTVALNPDVGSIAPGSIVSTENTAYFLSDRGIYELTEDSVVAISSKIESVIQGLDHSLFSRVVAVHHRAYREVWFYFPDVGVYIWNYRVRQWTGPRTGIFTSSVPYSMWGATDASSNPIVLAGFDDGFVRQADPSASILTDDVLSSGTGGTSFTPIIQCHRMYMGDASTETAFRWIYVTANLRGSQTSTVSFTTDNGDYGVVTFPLSSSSLWSSSQTWNSSNAWNSGASGTKRVQANGRGSGIDITITDDGSAQSVYSGVDVFGFDYGLRAA